MISTAETRSKPTSVRSALIAAVALVFSVSAFAQHGHAPPGEEFRNPYAWPSLDSLVELSDTIVAGEVLDMRSSWSTDRREIFTTVTLRPDRRFKGGGRSLVRFRIPGGTVGDTRLTVTHSPVFAVGEHALVFLAGDSGRLPRVVAGEAGKRHIRTGADGEQTILPGFATSDGGPGGTTGLGTLDDLAAAMPRLLTAARPR
ncbi:MAG: hypothetical protein F4023_07200 [Acidobacteria bacterium]|nr:hypothetical protein [Acidobacteriota bacterium]MYH50353.1 hypothetical protein [Gammaproteobacteria bacterium]MYK79420.1 hypothetical protein [Acidobacteriota bacterium]